MRRTRGEVDQRAAQEVSGELNALQHRLAELESDVQYYRQVVSEQTGSTGLMISRFDLKPTDKANTKRYKLVLRQQDADGDTYLEGRVNVTLAGRQSGQLSVWRFERSPQSKTRTLFDCGLSIFKMSKAK